MNKLPVNEIDFTPLKKDTKKGRKRKLYLVLDCETATLPFIKQMELTAKDKQKLSIAKPLIYDLGWKVVDRKGHVYSQHSFLIQETFFVPQVFNTAYYAWKRPMYMERYEKGEIICKTWAEATEILLSDMEKVDMSLAYNAMFDFKKALPYTERYINALYSTDYQRWENRQRKSCQDILDGKEYDKPEFDPHHFLFRDLEYPIADLWGLSCLHLINEEKYKINCLKQGMISPSGLFFKTSAESTFRFLIKDYDFLEEHTALSDTNIETEILLKILKKVGIKTGIEYFPFRELGKTVDFILSKKDKKAIKKLTPEMVAMVVKTMYEKHKEYDVFSSFASNLEWNMMRLETYLEETYKIEPSTIYYECCLAQLVKELNRKIKYADKLKAGGKAKTLALEEIEKMEKEKQELALYIKGRKMNLI